MITNATIHIRTSDEIGPRRSADYQWIVIENVSLFASNADFIRLRDAIDALLIARPQDAGEGQ